MRIAFITFGILLLFWGLASVIFAVQDVGTGVSARPRQEIAYAAAFLVSGGVLTAAGTRRYALNRMLVLGAALLHAAIYSGGAALERLHQAAPAGPAVAVSSVLFIGTMVSFQRAHRAHTTPG